MAIFCLKYKYITKKANHSVSLKLNQRLPITPHCGFLIAASQLEKSYIRMKVMCGSHASLRSSVSSHPTFPRSPGRIGSRNAKKRHTLRCAFSLISDFLSSQAVSSQVLSAFTSLTTVFEMGTGGPS